MKYAVKDHQHKSLSFIGAMTARRHTLVPLGEPADLLLIDLDLPHPLYTPLIDHYYARGAKIVLYPHGAAPFVCYDGIYPPDPRVDVQLVPAQGHVAVMRAYGVTRRLEVVGFPFPQRPFRAPAEQKQVLFAPFHPCGSGWNGEREMAQNAAVFASLLKRFPVTAITVRHVGTLAQNGLKRAVRGVRYVQGAMEVDWTELDSADVCVAAYGTYAHLAVARGCPTIVYGQDIRPYEGEGDAVEVANWERYREVYRYPWDLEVGLDKALAASRNEASRWREWFIGAEFDAQRFVGIVEELVETKIGAAA